MNVMPWGVVAHFNELPTPYSIPRLGLPEAHRPCLPLLSIFRDHRAMIFSY